jgi:hypothetical protein
MDPLTDPVRQTMLYDASPRTRYSCCGSPWCPCAIAAPGCASSPAPERPRIARPLFAWTTTAVALHLEYRGQRRQADTRRGGGSAHAGVNTELTNGVTARTLRPESAFSGPQLGYEAAATHYRNSADCTIHESAAMAAQMITLVESKMGAVAWGLWPSPRFPSPLIEP